MPPKNKKSKKIQNTLKNIIIGNRLFFLKQIKPRKSAPPKIKKWINRFKNKKIQRLIVCRKPVQSAVKNVLDIVSFGKFSKSLKGLRYEDIFHLYIYITIENKTWRIEKNEVVTVVKDDRDIHEDCMNVNLFQRRIKLKDFIEKGKSFQKRNFWSYNAKGNNCQNFAESLMVGNRLIKKEDKIHVFIKQDSEAIFRNNPRYLAKFGKTMTDIAGVFDIIKSGFR